MHFRYTLALTLFAVAASAAEAQLPLLRTFESPNSASGGWFGYAVAGVPDTDGDGRGDVLIGAPTETSTIVSRMGRAYGMNGATGATQHILVSPIANVTTDGRYGYAVAGLPDVNGDGRGDYVVGALQEGVNGVARAGRAYIRSGATGAVLFSLVSSSPHQGGEFGRSVAAVPDVNGDGVADVLVGAPREQVGGVNGAGRAYLFSGATGALLRTLTAPTPQAGAEFGIAVAGVPDCTGDGRGDLAVSAWGMNESRGRVHLFNGATGGHLRFVDSPNAIASGRFGYSVAGVPDATGDGRGDVVVGAYNENVAGASLAGRAYLINGATGAVVHTLLPLVPRSSGFFGYSVAGVPDVTGDGRSDLLVGEARGGGSTSGLVYLISGATGERVVILESPAPEFDGRFGGAVAVVPDVDGDGRTDLLIGANREDGGAALEGGRAYLFSTSTIVSGEPTPDAGGLALSADPNPAAGAATVRFTLAQPGPVRLVLADVLGREVAVLASGERAAGAHAVPWDASRLAPGVYVVRLAADGTAAERRVTVAR